MMAAIVITGMSSKSKRFMGRWVDGAIMPAAPPHDDASVTNRHMTLWGRVPTLRQHHIGAA